MVSKRHSRRYLPPNSQMSRSYLLLGGGDTGNRDLVMTVLLEEWDTLQRDGEIAVCIYIIGDLMWARLRNIPCTINQTTTIWNNIPCLSNIFVQILILLRSHTLSFLFIFNIVEQKQRWKVSHSIHSLWYIPGWLSSSTPHLPSTPSVRTYL